MAAPPNATERATPISSLRMYLTPEGRRCIDRVSAAELSHRSSERYVKHELSCSSTRRSVAQTHEAKFGQPHDSALDKRTPVGRNLGEQGADRTGTGAQQ